MQRSRCWVLSMQVEDFRGRHLGQRCFILGSGPSIAGMDLSALKDEITFSCNNGYLLFQKLGFPTTYWAVEDALDAEQFGRAFTAFQGPVKFAAADLELAGCIPVPFGRQEPSTGTPAGTAQDSPPWPTFAPGPPFAFGGTVSYLLLQLAAYMGCGPSYLLGHDFRWSGELAEASGVQRASVDRDHFDPAYWPTGSRSFAPQPERMRRAFVAANRAMRVVNLTPNTALDVFETRDYADLLAYDDMPLPQQQVQGEIDAFYQYVVAERPHHVIEIGVAGGGSSALWHRACSGLVIGVDPHPCVEAIKRLPRFHAAVGDSHTHAVQETVFAELGGESADLLFIDGDHSLAGVTADYEDYKRFVRPGGLIAFHDINAADHWFEPWEHGGVPRFWRELVNDSKQEFTVHADIGGIGVVRA